MSIRPRGSRTLGTRTELKNLNSFRHVQKAIEYEISRQSDLLEDGEKVVQETRLYDAARNITLAMRGKEDAQDYRYFPDPDLVPVDISEEELAGWKETQPELPQARLARFMKEWKLPEADAVLLAADPHLAALFENAVRLYPESRKIANLMLGPLLRQINEQGLDSAGLKLSPEALAELARIIDSGLISAKIGAEIFPELMRGGVMPEDYVKTHGLPRYRTAAQSRRRSERWWKPIPLKRQAYRGGKTKLISFFVGQVMLRKRGKATPP